MKKNCEICGNEFTTHPAWIRKGKNAGRCCSKKCKNILRSINQRGTNNPCWRGGKITITCKQCGRTKKMFPSQTKNNEGQFCNKKCYGKWISEHNRGKNNPNWRGGINPEIHQIRCSDKYNQWRQQVFIRDNFTCQNCGDATGGNIEAHHEKQFIILLQETQKYLPLMTLYDAAMLYTPLWDIDNGKTLCDKCHQKKKNRHRNNL